MPARPGRSSPSATSLGMSPSASPIPGRAGTFHPPPVRTGTAAPPRDPCSRGPGSAWPASPSGWPPAAGTSPSARPRPAASPLPPGSPRYETPSFDSSRVTPQPPGRTPHKAPQAPLRCPGGEDPPPEASEAPAREADDMTAPGAPAPIRVLVVDDQELVRSGFCVILDAADGITVVGEAANGEAAVSQVAAHEPDVVLMDIRMPGMDGLEATRLITGGAPAAPKVVMLTTFDLDDYVYEALRAGASGFLLKDSPRHDLIAAVRAAAAGDALLAPSVTRRLIEAFARRPPETSPSPSQLASLTAREREVLLLLARGRSNSEIAAKLFVSEATVKTHVGNLLAKLGLRDRVQAVILAYETGIVVPGDPSASV